MVAPPSAPAPATATAMATTEDVELKTAERSNRSPADDGHKAPWFKATLSSGAPVGVPAPYADKTASFTHRVDIESDSSFCMKAFWVNGHHVLVLVPAGAFRLLDLPIELRKVIYGHLLTRDEPIKLKNYRDRVVQQSFASGNADSKEWDDTLKKWKSAPDRYLTAITEVSKEVHREATEVLYSTNRFVFVNAWTLERLANIAPRGFKHLRDIEVAANYRSKHHLAFVMLYLKDCPNLRSLGLPHASICTTPDTKNPAHPRTPIRISPIALADACFPFLKNLQDIRRQKQIMGSVLDVVSSPPCGCFWCKQMLEQPSRLSAHCYCKNLAAVIKKANDFWKAFRDRVRLRLALADVANL